MKPARSAPLEGDPPETLVDANGVRHVLAIDHRTEGRARLRAKVFAHGNQAAVARQLGVSPQRLHSALTTHRPDADLIARAWLVLGIPGHLWGVAPLDE